MMDPHNESPVVVDGSIIFPMVQDADDSSSSTSTPRFHRTDSTGSSVGGRARGAIIGSRRINVSSELEDVTKSSSCSSDSEEESDGEGEDSTDSNEDDRRENELSLWDKPGAFKKERDWIESIIGESLVGEDLAQSLKDGIVLCKIVNAIRPGIIPNPTSGNHEQNVVSYLSACKLLDVAVPHSIEEFIFNVPNMVQHIRALAATAAASPEYTGPKLDLQLPPLNFHFKKAASAREFTLKDTSMSSAFLSSHISAPGALQALQENVSPRFGLPSSPLARERSFPSPSPLRKSRVIHEVVNYDEPITTQEDQNNSTDNPTNVKNHEPDAVAPPPSLAPPTSTAPTSDVPPPSTCTTTSATPSLSTSPQPPLLGSSSVVLPNARRKPSFEWSRHSTPVSFEDRDSINNDINNSSNNNTNSNNNSNNSWISTNRRTVVNVNTQRSSLALARSVRIRGSVPPGFLNGGDAGLAELEEKNRVLQEIAFELQMKIVAAERMRQVLSSRLQEIHSNPHSLHKLENGRELRKEGSFSAKQRRLGTVRSRQWNLSERSPPSSPPISIRGSSSSIPPLSLSSPTSASPPASPQRPVSRLPLSAVIETSSPSSSPPLFPASLHSEDGSIIMMELNGRSVIKGGTITSLVDRLLLDDNSAGGLEFATIFLLTYRAFMSPKDLMVVSIEKYNQIRRSDDDEDTKRRLSLRVCNFLKRWVENFFHDFEGDAELIESYERFVADMKDKDTLLSAILERSMKRQQLQHQQQQQKQQQQQQSQHFEISFDQDAPKPILPKEIEHNAMHMFLDIHPLEFARQLTIIQFSMYRKIPPKEFLCLSWQKDDKETRSPFLLAFIRNFNKVSWWIVACIVQESDLRRRAKALKNVFKIISECRKLNNFNAVFALIAGLNSAPVHRLKKTWEAAGVLKVFEEWTALTANRGSWKAYRQALHSADPPCIPYLGVYLSDLTFIEENKTFLENGMINVFKCRKVADVITEIQQYQQKPYNLKTVESIQRYIQHGDIINERLAFKTSLKIEPRESMARD